MCLTTSNSISSGNREVSAVVQRIFGLGLDLDLIGDIVTFEIRHHAVESVRLALVAEHEGVERTVCQPAKLAPVTATQR